MTVRERGCAHHGGPFAGTDATLHYPPDARLELIALALELRVDLGARTLDGVARHTFRGRSGARSVSLDAVDFESISVEGARASYDGEKLTLVFDTPFAEGELRETTVRFRVVEPTAGLYFSSPTESAPDASLFAVTDHETERARHWLPTIDHPSVRPTLRFAITARSELTVLANGRLEAETDAGEGWKTSTYVLDAPCPSYLTCFAIGDFVRFEGTPVRDVPVVAYAPRPFTEAHLARTFGKTSAMLSFLEGLLGTPYPFPKYAQFAATGIGGAMENISLVSWDDRFVLDEALATEESDLVDVVNVHEMAHSWFGDHLVCRDHSHAWLKESWATYVESLYLEHHEGPDALAYDLLGQEDAYFTEHDDRYRRPIVTRRFESSWDLFDAHLYPGGSLRLHMLRRKLGDAEFFEGMRLYLARHAGGLVETDDFRRAMEQASGRSLARFFDDWFHGTGFAELEVTTEFDAESRMFTVQVGQKPGETPDFELELEVDLRVGGTMRTLVVPVSKRRGVGAVHCEQDPDLVALDPRGKLLARFEFEPGQPRLLAALAHAPALRTRVDAARRLARSGKDRAVSAVGEALLREPFHGVRITLAHALASVGTTRAMAALLDALGAETDARVLPTLLRALASYRDPRVLSAVMARIDRALAPRALEAAYETLGAQLASGGLDEPARRAAFDALADAASVPGIAGFAPGGALRGLGQVVEPAAFARLERALARGGAPWRARPHAATALGRLGKSLGMPYTERAERALSGALRDDDRKVRAAAATALITLGRAGGLAAVQAHATRLPKQDRVRLERALREAATPASEATKLGTERLDALVKQVEALARRLDTLEAKPGAEPDGAR